MKFLQSIKFKLTAWYTIAFIFTSLILIGLFNIFAVDYYKKDIIETLPLQLRQKVDAFGEAGIKPPIPFRDVLREIRNEDLVRLQQISLLTIIFVAIASAIGGYIVAGRMLSPIRKINKVAQKINADNLHINISDENSNDEIGELIQNFNAMTQRLKSSFESQQQFTENAAHELRTPITILYTSIENQLLNTDISADYKNSLEIQLKSLRRMTSLIDNLLLLSSLSISKSKSENEDLVFMIKEIIQELNTLSKEKNISLEFEHETDSLEIPAHKAFLTQAIINIIENAIKYSPADSIVKISLLAIGNEIQIKITDQGPGIPSELRSKIFERFYRIDNSRSRETGGFGLGLAIAKEIIELHGGKIEVVSEGKGATFKIILPLGDGL